MQYRELCCSGVGTTRNRTSSQAVIEERILMRENILAEGERIRKKGLCVCASSGELIREIPAKLMLLVGGGTGRRLTFCLRTIHELISETMILNKT